MPCAAMVATAVEVAVIPTLAEAAAMGAIGAMVAGPILQPTSVRSQVRRRVNNFQCQRTKMRAPSAVSRSQSHRVNIPSYVGLRAVHTPALTPVISPNIVFQKAKKVQEEQSHVGQREEHSTPSATPLIALRSANVFQSTSEGQKQSHVCLTEVKTHAARPVIGLRSTNVSQKTTKVRKQPRFIARAISNLSTEVMNLITRAQEEVEYLGYLTIGSRNILLGLISQYVCYFLFQIILNKAFRMVSAGIRRVTRGFKKTTLIEYGTNLSKLAEEGKLDPVVGRQKQIDHVVQILSRRTKNNPCLIGEPGVGKTAIAEGLAQLIATGDVPETIQRKMVISLDMGLLVAGTQYRGEFEERLKNIMEEIRKNGKIIVFIDEVHTLVAAGSVHGGALDAANILKPALARGELQCIGATTIDEYRKHIEKDPALERRFQPVKITEPTVGETIGILKGLRERYEGHHKVQYTDKALVAAAQLSHKLISDRFLPDKAIDLMDEAGSFVGLRNAQCEPSKINDLEAELKKIIKHKNESVRAQYFRRAKQLRDNELELRSKISALTDKNKQLMSSSNMVMEPGTSSSNKVTEEDIRHIISVRTGVPVQKVSMDESRKLLKMEETLHTRVVGQDEAVTAISRAIRRARVGLKNPGRPVGSFVFAGPTGVGKSELAKALAACYYGSEDAMVRVDMSEFMEKYTVSKLIGSPPGYMGHDEGGQLTEAVRRQPAAVVLLDEFEKAHRDVYDLMLQVLDDGRLTDGKGRTVDFKNTLIIMTSNLGSNLIVKNNNSHGVNKIKDMVIDEMKTQFRPEFMNRLDEVIVFQPLTKLEVGKIARIMVEDFAGRMMREKGIKLRVTERLKELLVEEGFDPSYGARPLRRAVVRLLEDTLTEKMLTGEVMEGDSVIVDADSAGNGAVVRRSNTKPSV